MITSSLATQRLFFNLFINSLIKIGLKMSFKPCIFTVIYLNRYQELNLIDFSSYFGFYLFQFVYYYFVYSGSFPLIFLNYIFLFYWSINLFHCCFFPFLVFCIHFSSIFQLLIVHYFFFPITLSQTTDSSNFSNSLLWDVIVILFDFIEI